MNTGKRAQLAVAGGSFCAIAGSIFGGLIVSVFQVIKTGGIGGMSFIPVAILYAAVVAVPFGFFVGSFGSWWLVGRFDKHIPSKRIFCESLGVGALLGAVFPSVMALAGWGPYSNLVSVVPISVGIGVICAALLMQLMHAYLVRRAK
jgi:hypothetical protein